jgi:hypothetical protein
MMDHSGDADPAPNPASLAGVVLAIAYGAEAVLIGRETRGALALSLYAAGGGGCWLIYLTARRTRSGGVTALVGIGLMILIPIALFVLFAATYPADAMRPAGRLRPPASRWG